MALNQITVNWIVSIDLCVVCDEIRPLLPMYMCVLRCNQSDSRFDMGVCVCVCVCVVSDSE